MRHRPLHIARFLPVGLAAGLCLGPTPAAAQGYGFDWVTVGDPGNRDTLPHETPYWPDLNAGGVDYEYRLSRTELTVAQHFDYVQAYWPYLAPEQRRGTAFLGVWIRNRGTAEDPDFFILDGADNRPSRMSWRHAARLCNWLHNGKASERWAFEDGAYDTSTFGYNDDGTLTDQAAHHPDARFWLPTMDEYVKGMFWDPAKEGGEGGYWMYPHSKDVPPIPGAPWDGGETNAGTDRDDVPYLDVGSYPWAASPWRLLDGSGGEREWVETLTFDSESRFSHGSRQYDPMYDIWDAIDHWDASDPSFADGVRMATVVPSPGTAAIFVVAGGLILRRKRT
jgi:formylglycine-generating enzyme